MRRRLLVGTVTVASAAVTVLLGGALNGGNGAPAASPSSAPAAGPRDVAAPTEAVVARLQSRIRSRPRDARSLAELGLAYEQRLRETADPSYLEKANAVLQRALRLDGRSELAVTGLGSLALSRHSFRHALVLGRHALRLNPASDEAYGIVGDASLELGRYADAFRAFDRMAALDPGVASYARVAYARELLGRPDAAVAAMRLAVAASTGRPEAEAWTRVELGKLLFGMGRVAAAADSERAALAVFPNYPYALDALARAEAARGRLDRAIALSRRAVTQVPLPQFASTLAELLRAGGRTREADEQDALIGAITRLLRANGVRTDLEVALYDVDHGLRLPRALELARRAHRDRPSIQGDDVLGWALTRNGRCAQGVAYARRALRLGTRDAVMYFHRGMAERCVGNEAEGRTWFRRAIALNPHFSPLWAPVAREALR
jgi:tetratricopeptide (TPR) repeat protein